MSCNTGFYPVNQDWQASCAQHQSIPFKLELGEQNGPCRDCREDGIRNERHSSQAFLNKGNLVSEALDPAETLKNARTRPSDDATQ